MSLAQSLFEDLSCPACGGPGLQSAGERVLCGYCGAQYAQARAFCVNCRHVNREGADFCEACGDPLSRRCPACRETNWIGAEWCAKCGQALDILEYLYQRHRQSTADYLNQARQEARVLKEQEEEAARRRSESLWSIERQRQRAVAAAADRQRERDRTTMQLVVTGLILFCAVLIAAGVFLAAR
jgi:hypothetical protein